MGNNPGMMIDLNGTMSKYALEDLTNVELMEGKQNTTFPTDGCIGLVGNANAAPLLQFMQRYFKTHSSLRHNVNININAKIKI